MTRFIWFGLMANICFATHLDYLKILDEKSPKWKVEKKIEHAPRFAPINVELKEYYEEFAQDGVVTIYLAHGKDGYNSYKNEQIFAMLKKAKVKEKLPISKINYDKNVRKISFKNIITGVWYKITLGHERDEYAKSYNRYEVVMYHGHSRYGRGPAFEAYDNYFRIGRQFLGIEVRANNMYFQKSDVALLNDYPLKTKVLNDEEVFYQYMGGKTTGSYLGKDLPVINVKPNEDFENAKLLPGKQIIWYQSCSNIHYWRRPFRERFPDTENKLVIGSNIPSTWSSLPTISFFSDLIKETKTSVEIVENMNATDTCGPDCFVAY